KKRPFLTFIVVVGALVAVAVWYIQSPAFARQVKRLAARYLPNDLGIDGDFSEFAVKFFPPGISIRNPKLQVQRQNVADLPVGMKITAERIDLIFLPLQMFSGKISVSEVVIVSGDVFLPLPGDHQTKKNKHAGRSGLHWDDLVSVRIDAAVVQNTQLQVTSPSGTDLSFLANYLRLAQEKTRAGPGYRLSMEIKDLDGKFTSSLVVPTRLERIRASGQVNALGLRFEELSAISAGIEISSSGLIKGNILEPKGLVLDANVNLKGDLQSGFKMAEILKRSQIIASRAIRPFNIPVQGRVAFSGKVKAELDSVLETLKVEGRISGSALSYEQWSAEDLSAEGVWTASPKGGEIAITHAEIISKERKRVGGTQPGGGGKIELGPVQYSLENPGPISVPLQLTDAHVHWLGAGALKDVYPLNFKVSGPAEITFNPPTKATAWGVQTKLEFQIKDFQLDNQRLGKIKPLHKVLDIQGFELTGGLAVDPSGIKPVGLFLKLPNSQLGVSGKIDFKTGYDLYASGPVSLSDFGEIAENKIRGDGTLDIHAHGPSSRVFIDFDTDIKDAFYLNLNLGQLKGRLTWDDDPSHLIFTNCNLKKGSTTYIGNGEIDLGKSDAINLDFKVPQGNIYDFIQIFDVLTKDLAWLPRTLVGGLSGDFAVTGGIDLKALRVLANFSGTNWEYWGERFKNVSIKGGYDRGKYLISDFQATKQGKKLYGKISYDQNKILDWSFRTAGMLLNDLDHFAALDVPVRGVFNLNSSGNGKEGSIVSNTDIQVTGFAVRGLAMPDSEASIKAENGILKINGVALGGQGIVDATYGSTPGTKNTIRLDAKKLDFSTVILLLNPTLMTDRSLAGSISGELQLSYFTGKADRLSGRVDLLEYVLAKTGSVFQLTKPVSFKLSDGTFDIRDILIESRGRKAMAWLNGREGRLEGKIVGDTDISLAEFFTSSVTSASGKMELSFAIGGRITEPTFFGKAVIENGRLVVPSVETPFENISGTFQLRQNVIAVQGLTSELAGGHVSAEGTLTVLPDRYPTLALKGTLSGNKLKVPPFQFAKVSGALTLEGDKLPYQVEGNVVVTSALWKEKVMNQKQSGSLRAMRYTPPPTQLSEGGSSKFRLNIGVQADHGVFVQNDLFDAEVKAKMTVVNTLETPRLLGSAEVIQGKMFFKDRVFQIQSANAIFDNPAVLNPKFSLTATTDVSRAKIQLFASGQLDKIEKIKTEWSSNPVMPEGEILQLLALGMTSSELKKIGSGDRSIIEQSEAASLILHSLDFNREVQKQTGFQIQLEESVNTQTGTSVFRPSQGDAAATRIVIRKKLPGNFEITGGSTVGGTQNEKQGSIEYRVNPSMSGSLVIDNYIAPDAEGNRTSYGADFKWEKRFK
ncbi:MAG: translocation/assembly module TamB domain-containing protein, partial [Bdellovibrionota bacterium]